MLTPSRGVEIAHGNFACCEMASGKSNFCILLFAYKSMWPPGIGQKGAVDSSADIPVPTACGEVWPHGRMQHPFAWVPAATSFDQGVKGRKTPFSPAPSEKYLRHFSTAPNQLGENPFLLMQAECERFVPTLTPVAGLSFRRRPAGLHQIEPRQNVP